jgi:CO/xanthine dehydrogenase Mo-binding subunit
VPDSGTTVASRGTIMGGGAVTIAARELKRRIAEAVCGRLRCAAEEVLLEGDQVLDGGRQRRIPFAEAIGLMFQTQNFPHVVGVFKAPRVTWDEHTGQGDAYFTWVYGCQAVELTVSRKTGRVRLLSAVAAHDVGRAVNREMVRGQFFGGMAMATGYALHEEVRSKDGRITNLNLNSYRIPRAMDLPEMTAIVIENPDPMSPSGAKALGEPTNEILAPAIANAVCHATGLRQFSLPIRLSAVPEDPPEDECRL